MFDQYGGAPGRRDEPGRGPARALPHLWQSRLQHQVCGSVCVCERERESLCVFESFCVGLCICAHLSMFVCLWEFVCVGLYLCV